MSTIRQQLAEALTKLLEARAVSDSETARELGITRQRLYQLKKGDRDASPEAIERAINALGYRVAGVTLEKL